MKALLIDLAWVAGTHAAHPATPGWTVVRPAAHATTGELVALAARERPALIATGIHCSVADRIALAEALAAEPSTADIPLLLVSARTGLAYRVVRIGGSQIGFHVRHLGPRGPIALADAVGHLAAAIVAPTWRGAAAPALDC